MSEATMIAAYFAGAAICFPFFAWFTIKLHGENDLKSCVVLSLIAVIEVSVWPVVLTAGLTGWIVWFSRSRDVRRLNRLFKDL